MNQNRTRDESKMAELAARAKFTGPTWYYDTDGDCVEFLTKEVSFYADRLNDWVTVYYSYESNELVGSQIKNIRELLTRVPGFLSLEIEHGKVKLSHLYRASGWSCSRVATSTAAVYRDLIFSADNAGAEVELCGV